MQGSSLGKRLQSARQAKGWSRRRLAEESGVSEPTVSRVELYDVEPKLTTLQALADALEVPIADLIGTAA